MNTNEYLTPLAIISNKKFKLSMSAFRLLLLNRKSNGMAACVKKINNRILVRMDLFESWFKNYKQQRKKILQKQKDYKKLLEKITDTDG